MIRVAKFAAVVGLALGLCWSALPAAAQNAPSAGAIAAAKELLALKNASAMYTALVPNVVQRTKQLLVQNNLNYQKDLDEVAVKVAHDLAGQEQAVGDEMAKVYATDFTEKELRDLIAFYKTPLGKKLLEQEPRTIQASFDAMNKFAQAFAQTVEAKFRAEMRARNKPI
jgi:hypothetical protein